MAYHLFTPAPPLRPFIESYWALVTYADAMPFQQRIPVDGRADIVFNFGSHYLRNDAQGIPQTLAVSHIDAQRTYPLSIAQQGHIHLLGVRFHPGGLAAFMREPQHYLTEHTLNLYDMLGRSAVVLEAQLYDAQASFCTQAALLDAFFLARLCLPSGWQAVQYMLGQLRGSGGLRSIQSLSHEVGYSIRTVDRLFSRLIGLTPKFCARIARYELASNLVTTSQLPLAEVALAAGYADQAHLTREFQQFAAQTPTQARAEQRLAEMSNFFKPTENA
jgi:AraC-like DNA-binding protein